MNEFEMYDAFDDTFATCSRCGAPLDDFNECSCRLDSAAPPKKATRYTMREMVKRRLAAKQKTIDPIVELLKQHPEGLKASQLVEMTKLSRSRIHTRLSYLKLRQIVTNNAQAVWTVLQPQSAIGS